MIPCKHLEQTHHIVSQNEDDVWSRILKIVSYYATDVLQPKHQIYSCQITHFTEIWQGLRLSSENSPNFWNFEKFLKSEHKSSKSGKTNGKKHFHVMEFYFLHLYYERLYKMGRCDSNCHTELIKIVAAIITYLTVYCSIIVDSQDVKLLEYINCSDCYIVWIIMNHFPNRPLAWVFHQLFGLYSTSCEKYGFFASDSRFIIKLFLRWVRFQR